MIIHNIAKREEKNILEKRSEDKDQKKSFGNLKRKYRLILIFLIGFLLILTFMILPMVIAILSQNLL